MLRSTRVRGAVQRAAHAPEASTETERLGFVSVCAGASSCGRRTPVMRHSAARWISVHSRPSSLGGATEMTDKCVCASVGIDVAHVAGIANAVGNRCRTDACVQASHFSVAPHTPHGSRVKCDQGPPETIYRQAHEWKRATSSTTSPFPLRPVPRATSDVSWSSVPAQPQTSVRSSGQSGVEFYSTNSDLIQILQLNTFLGRELRGHLSAYTQHGTHRHSVHVRL